MSNASYQLTQIVDKLPSVPDVAGNYAKFLNLLLLSCANQQFTEVLPPLGTSDYSLVHVQVDSKPHSDMPFHRTIQRYTKADWDKFRFYTSGFLKNGPSKPASLIYKWILTSIESFILKQKILTKAKQPALSHTCMCCGHTPH